MSPPAGIAALWIEGTLAAILILIAGRARAFAGREEALRIPGNAMGNGPPSSRAHAIAADLIWFGLLAPALLLIIHIAREWLPVLGAGVGFLVAVVAGLVVATALPLRLGVDRAGRQVSGLGPWLARLAYPLRPIVAHLVRRRAELPESEPARDEEKLLGRLLDATADVGAPDEAEAMLEAALVRRFLGRVLHLRETPVARIMRPRESIVWIGQREEARAAAELMSTSAYSRIPVCGRDLDDVVGILHLKDVFLAMASGPDHVTMGGIARPPSLIPAEMPLARVLASWRHSSGTMSLVRDETGRVIGLLTLADVIDWILAAPPSADIEADGPRPYAS